MNREVVLVTGATGFIGSHVVDAVLSKGAYSVIAISRADHNAEKIEALKRKGVTVVSGKFYDAILLEDIFRQFRIDHVIHLAALRGAGGGTWDDYNRINVEGTDILLAASLRHGVRKFLFCSSVGVHGTVPLDCPAKANSPLNGDTYYHASKIQAENRVSEYSQKGLDTYTFRPAITYGPGHTGFPSLLVTLVRKRMILLPPKDIKVHLLNVLDYSRLLANVLEAGPCAQRVFIVADEEPVLFKELVDLIYFHFYKREYPAILTMPNWCYAGLSNAFKFIGNEKWFARIQFVSKDWYYDIQDTVHTLKYVPSNSRVAFINSVVSR